MTGPCTALTMNRSALAERLAGQLGLAKKQVDAGLAEIFAALAAALLAGRRVELRGFGSFYTKAYASRPGRNPRTGETIVVPAKRTATFRASRALRQRLGQQPQ